MQSQLQQYLEDVESLASSKDKEKRIPAFAVSTNSTLENSIGFSLMQEVNEKCIDFIRKIDPLNGILASTSIPLIVQQTKIKNPEGDHEVFYDGYLSEDTPLLLPYQKWKQELKYGKRKKKIKFICAGVRNVEADNGRKVL